MVARSNLFRLSGWYDCWMQAPSMRAALQRLFARRTLGGWFLLAVFGLWKAIGVWGDVDFLLSKLAQARSWFGAIPSVAAIRAALAEHLTAVVLQWSLLIAGLVWLFIATSSRTGVPESARSESQQGAAPVLPTPVARRPKQRAELEREVGKLLTRAYKHGEVLLHSNDWTLARRWATQTHGMIYAAFGQEEAERFNNVDEGFSYEGPFHVMQQRLAKIADLGRRFPFTKVRDDFEPERWKEE